MTLGGNVVLNQHKGQNKKYSQNFHKVLAPQGIAHQKLLKLMKAIMPEQRRLP